MSDAKKKEDALRGRASVNIKIKIARKFENTFYACWNFRPIAKTRFKLVERTRYIGALRLTERIERVIYVLDALTGNAALGDSHEIVAAK